MIHTRNILHIHSARCGSYVYGGVSTVAQFIVGTYYGIIS